MIKKKELSISEYIKNEVINNITNNNLIVDGDKIVVAVSGGPDSMCLLNVLNDIKSLFKLEYNISYSLIVAHVNHGIRKESESEKEYVESFCKKLNIQFFYLKEDVINLAKENKLSTEACGRKVRYDFFYQVMKENNATKIAVAHNKNDDVETILLNLIRGCGIKGLTGMDFIHDNIIRPLLTIEKKQILEYNEYEKLNPCFDKTNDENIYLRNKIRNKLIPLLNKEYNSNFTNNVIRMKNILTEDENFLEEYTNTIFDKCVISNKDSKIVFNTKIITQSHVAVSNRVIRKIINKKVGNLDLISNIHVNDIYILLKNGIKGKKYVIKNKFTIENISKDTAVIY